MRIDASDKAKQDLEDIKLYSVENFGDTQAVRYARALGDAMDIIAEHPNIGIRCDSVSAGLRRYECMSHTIYYRIAEQAIKVVRVLHSSMDPALHLG